MPEGHTLSEFFYPEVLIAHITSFVVEGLAGRSAPYSKNLDRHLNIFFGLNGSGKTSLLKILHSAMTGDATPLGNVPFKRAEVEIYTITHDTVIKIKCQKPDILTAQTEATTGDAEEAANRPATGAKREKCKLEWTQPPVIKGTRLSRSWAHRYLPTSRLYFSERMTLESLITPTMKLSEEQLENLFEVMMGQVWQSYSGDIWRAVQKAQAQGLAEILKDVLAPQTDSEKGLELDATEAYRRVARFLQRQGYQWILGNLNSFEDSYLNNENVRKVVSDINKVEAKVEESTAPRNKLEALIKSMFSGNKRVEFEDKAIKVIGAEGENIGVARLSSGEKHLMRILVECMLAESNSLIIDEPELSLHVDWQKPLVSSLSGLNSNMQLIMATHSPEITGGLKDENLFRL